MTKDQQMQVRQLQEQQGNNPDTKQASTEAVIAAVEAQLGINSQPKKGDGKKRGRDSQRTNVGKKQRESCNYLQCIA